MIVDIGTRAVRQLTDWSSNDNSPSWSPCDDRIAFTSYRDPSGRQVEKGFHSNNERHRTQTDPGFAPRLLIRVQLPEGVAVSQTSLTPFLPSDTYLTVARPVTMLWTRQSTTWPAEWKVSP